MRYSDRMHQAGIALLLLVVSLLAWTSMLNGLHGPELVPMHHAPMAVSEPLSLAAFGTAFWMWSVMMVAMMVPSVVPMLLAYTRIRQRHSVSPRLDFAAAGFLLGYWANWLVFCVLAGFAQCCLQESGLLSPMLESRSAVFSGTVLLLAGVYQLTPWKAICLRHCRSSASLVAPCHGKSTAVGAGMHHGAVCLGSCWALMIMMFAFGVMNMLWMGLITLFVALEKTLPGNPGWLRSASGVALVAIAGAILLPDGLVDRIMRLDVEDLQPALHTLLGRFDPSGTQAP